MDLTFDASELAFRDELRAWLAENPPEPEPERSGDERSARGSGDEDVHYAWRRDYERRLAEGG
jgi:hypothetical protein